MSERQPATDAGNSLKVCAKFLDYILGKGYLIVDLDSLRARAPRYGEEADRMQGIVEMSTPINPLRLAYDFLDLECPTSHTEDGIMAMRENYRRLSGGGK